jgi:VWFA-related protein
VTFNSQEQTAGSEHRSRFSSDVRYVLVPVVVTDHNGNHVSGLTKTSFRLLEDGKPQQIASLEEIRTTAEPVIRVVTGPNEFTNETVGDVAPRRLVIILVDLLSPDFASQGYARQGVISYLASHLELDSLYQIVALDGRGLRYLHDFSDTSESLLVAAKYVAAHSGKHSPDSGGATSEMKGDAKIALLDAFAGEAEMRIAGDAEIHLKAFQNIAYRVSGLPGRKELIWLTTSNTIAIIPTGVRRDKLYLRTMQALEQAQISIYPVDPSGLQTGQIDATDGITGIQMRNQRATQALAAKANAIRAAHESMRSIAEATGGRAYFNRNDTDNLIRDAVRDGSAYYMLSYRVDRMASRPGWRAIRVTADQYRVQARAGYFLEDNVFDPSVEMASDLDLALVSPIDYTGLPLRLKIGMPTAANGEYELPFVLSVGKGAIRADASNSNRLFVAYSYIVRTPAGADVGHKGTLVDRHLTAAQVQQVENQGVGYADSVKLPPGRYSIRVVARDNLTGRIGSVLGAITLK